MAKYTLSDIFVGDYPISQYFGARPEYYKQFGFNGHEGVDWATPTGVKIVAPFDYKVISDIDDLKSGAYGNYIVLWDPIQKCAIWLCHLKENYVSVGKTGKRGDLVALSDNSGNSTGPHLHVNFVETDSNGNRLNTGNGFKGMLNILDPNLVEWKLGGEINPIPPGGGASMYKGYDLTNQESMKVAVDILVRVQSGEFVEKTKYDQDIKGKQETIDNLNQQINDRNNDIIQINGKLTTAISEKESLETRVLSLEEQAKKIPELQRISEEFEQRKQKWTEQEITHNRSIAQYKAENERLKKDLFGSLIREILNKITKRFTK